MLVVAGCTDSGNSSDNGGETTGTEDTGGSDTTGGGEYITCECVQLDQVCTGLVHQAAQGCYIDNPCGVITGVEGNENATECVLQMLVDQVPARFYYELADANMVETNSGWFYILGPKSGLETGCYKKANGTQVPNANYYELEDPSHFEACLGLGIAEMTSCLFGGLILLEPFPTC